MSRGPHASPRRRTGVDAASVFAVAVLAIAVVLLGVANRNEALAWQWLTHTREVLERLQEVVSLSRAAESSQRGYLLTRQAPFLGEMRAAQQAVPATIDAIATLTRDNPRQQQALPELRRLAQERLQFLERVIAASRDGVLDEEGMRGGIAAMQALERRLSAMRDEERRLLVSRQAEVARTRRLQLATISAVGVLALALVGILRTVSRRDARELANANRQLESRVAERTAQLTALNEDLQAFAHTVAHDLRAPLRNIEGFASALVEDEAQRLSSEGQMYLERVRAGVHRMDQLITDLLTYSRLARGDLKLEPVALGSAVAQALRELERPIGEGQASVQVQPALPQVVGNRPLLVQVLVNAVSNAIKFVAPGTAPQVRIEARREGDWVRLAVSDNGIGIPPAHRERVFGVFERLHGQEAYAGTGIGLAIVQRAVAKMHGTVAIEDSALGGTTLALRLPAA